MARRFDLTRLLGAVMLFAALWLVPSFGMAHPVQHVPAAQAALVSLQIAACSPSSATATPDRQDLTSAVPAEPANEDNCGGRGCCANGPCGGSCHGFVLISVPGALPPTHCAQISSPEFSPGLGCEAVRLRRPPKSFA